MAKSFKGFDYQGAINEGYQPQEIIEFLSEQRNFDLSSAREEGYSDNEIIEFLSKKPEKSALEKTGRIAAQFGRGIAETAAFPYEVAAAPLATEEMQTQAYRGNLMDDIEMMLEQKQTGVWEEKDQQFLDNLMDQLKDPQKSKEFIQTDDVSVRGLLERSTGFDFEPDGFVESAANVVGFLKKPAEIVKAGLNPKNLIKAIAPTGKEFLRGVGMEYGAELAEEGNFGPIGTLAMMAAGDVAGGKVADTRKLLKKPKDLLAKQIAKRANKKEAQELVKSLRESGITADLGTITNSDLVKMVQTKLDQSGLTGDNLTKLRESIFQDIKNEYKNVAEGINEYKFSNSYDAGQVLKNTLDEVREAEYTNARKSYRKAVDFAPDAEVVDGDLLRNKIKTLRSDLEKGGVKSAQQKAVLKEIQNLEKDLYKRKKVGDKFVKTAKNASPRDLLNSKLGLQDVVNYEVEGGAKQLLKDVIAKLDESLIRYGKEKNEKFLKQYQKGKSQYQDYIKTYRNKSIQDILRQENPERALRQLDTIDGINRLEKALSKNPEGRFLYEALKRYKLDDMFSKSMVNSLEEQLKIGQFKNVLKDPKNSELAKRLLGPVKFKRLKKLSENADVIQRSAAKFMNPSKSGVVVADIAAVSKLLTDFSQIFYGNPFPLMKSGGILTSGRYLTELMGDTEFIKMVEDLILAEKKNDVKKLTEIGERLKPYAKEYLDQSRSE